MKMIDQMKAACALAFMGFAVAGDVHAATLSLPFNFAFGTRTYSEAELNDNGTISFGDAYLADGPGLDFLSPAPSITAVIAPGFGSYGSVGNWSSASTENGVALSFAGDDSFSGATVRFAVELFNNGAFAINYFDVPDDVAQPGTIAIGLYERGNPFSDGSPEANPGGDFFTADKPNAMGSVALGYDIPLNDPFFFYDYSLPGAGDQTQLSGIALRFGTAPAVPEPGTLALMLAPTIAALAMGRRRRSGASAQ